jgi:CBS domain-containing protein
MRTDIPAAEPETDLDTVQQLMQAHEVKALPVVSDGYIKGVITMDDISRAYTMLTASK